MLRRKLLQSRSSAYKRTSEQLCRVGDTSVQNHHHKPQVRSHLPQACNIKIRVILFFAFHNQGVCATKYTDVCVVHWCMLPSIKESGLSMCSCWSSSPPPCQPVSIRTNKRVDHKSQPSHSHCDSSDVAWPDILPLCHRGNIWVGSGGSDGSALWDKRLFKDLKNSITESVYWSFYPFTACIYRSI